jgi:hypothetical protein
MPGTGEQMKNIKEHIQENMEHFQLLSFGTNKVLAFSYKEKEYVVKKQALLDDHLSPFWRMMKDIFGSGFQKQRACMKTVCGLLEENPHIPPARLVLADEENKLQVFEKMPGGAWDPDEFPEGAGIAYQLGQFIGFNHSRSYEDFDLPGTGIGNLKKKIMCYMEETISLHWNGIDALDASVREYFIKLKATDIACDGLSLIMTDISANQFLFEGDRITACVDLDAYVLGPKAWELALIQNCVKDMESFKRGYEKYLMFPCFKEEYIFYMFLMALGDIWSKEEMLRFLRNQGLD